MQKFFNHKKEIIILLLIVALGGFFRLYNLNWDQGYHLHPDERFLTMVGNAMKIPTSFTDYLDPQISTFNPTNIGYKFFVYGTLPLSLNKIVAISLNNDNYNAFTIQGRFLSALFDLLVVVLVYKTAELFERKYNLSKNIKYLASFFYAISVLPIQLSHFFAVDTFLNFFMFASFYFALRFSMTKNIFNIIFSALFFGCALASKISTMYIAPLLMFFLFKNAFLEKKLYYSLKIFIIFGIIVYLTLRIADPYLFTPSNFFDIRINETFVTNLKTLKSFEDKNAWFPPAVQWLSKTLVIFSLYNLAVFGIGIPYFILILFGMFFVIKQKNILPFKIVLLWVIIFFAYQSTQFVKTMRYFIFLYPFLAIFAGLGFYYIRQKIKQISYILLIGTFIWPLFFMSIYVQKNSRIEASEWIYQNIEDGSFILSEHWDDPLPLFVENNYGKTFIGEQVPVFDPDTDEKWQKMNNLLNKADYYILSSNRAWGSIPIVPQRYPQMSKYYKELFDGKKEFKKIMEFTSYPSLEYLGIPITLPDDLAEEAFTVYDHPKVLIFKKL